jgi:hypothetical protein
VQTRGMMLMDHEPCLPHILILTDTQH